MLKVIQRDWQLYKHFVQLPPSPAPPPSTGKSQDSSAQNVTSWAGLSLLSQRHHHSLKGWKPCFPRILSRHGSGLEAANERNYETWKAKVKRKPYSRNAQWWGTVAFHSHFCGCSPQDPGDQKQWFLRLLCELQPLHLQCFQLKSWTTISPILQPANLHFPSSFHICVNLNSSIFLPRLQLIYQSTLALWC